MIIMTPQIDPTRQIPSGPTSFMTERNEHEVRCSMCARTIYVDDQAYRRADEAEVLCEMCAEAYEDVA